MKKKLIALLVLFLGFYFVFSYSSIHTDRNKNNLLPKGTLQPIGDNFYIDENKLHWEKQPQTKNKFHQTPDSIPPFTVAYPNVLDTLKFEPKNPNWKFLSRETAGSGSYEAILQPDGSYLTKGAKQGTYNYAHPSGFWGTLTHVFLDVIPHFFNDNYAY